MQQRHTISSAEQNIFCRESRNICDNSIRTLLPNPQTRVVANLDFGVYAKMHEQSRRVYSPLGIAPTVHTCGGVT